MLKLKLLKLAIKLYFKESLLYFSPNRSNMLTAYTFTSMKLFLEHQAENITRNFSE